MELLVFTVETLSLVAVLLAAIAQIFGVGGNKAGKKVGSFLQQIASMKKKYIFSGEKGKINSELCICASCSRSQSGS